VTPRTRCEEESEMQGQMYRCQLPWGHGGDLHHYRWLSDGCEEWTEVSWLGGGDIDTLMLNCYRLLGIDDPAAVP
jgi:hypothetical protein